MDKTLLKLFVAAATATGCCSLTAVTWYVAAEGGNDANDGLSTAMPFATIQRAIDAADYYDTVIVSDGVYEPVVCTKDISIKSVNGPAVTIIDAEKKKRCVLFGSFTESGTPIVASAQLDGFTLQNGMATNVVTTIGTTNRMIACGGGGYGGSFYNCVFWNNHAFNGGAAANTYLKGCEFHKNWANSDGGALYRVTAEDCFMSNNISVRGGGASQSNLDRCTVKINRTFLNMPSGKGAGVYRGSASNCLLIGNITGGDGGAAWNGTLVNCTIVANVATNSGGGAANATLKNCIVYGNYASESNNVCNCTMEYCCIDGDAVTGNGNITANPQFTDFLMDNYSILPTSPCVDAGNPVATSEMVDFLGNPRIVGATVDIGAIECQTIVGTHEELDFKYVWGAWSIKDDTTFSFPESLAGWDVLARFAWRARDRFVMASEVGFMPPSDKPVLISLGVFSFGGTVFSTTGETVPIDNEFGVPVWRVHLREVSGRFRATVGGVEVQTVSLPAYNADWWVESVYGTPPSWLTGSALSDWYVQRDRARLELFMTLVPADRYSDYVAAMSQEESALAPKDANRLTVRGFRANTSTNHLHYVNVRTPSEAIVNVLGATDLSGTNWTFCGIGSFARGHSTAGLVASNRTYFVKLAEGTGDSDGDGISDILESMVYGTDPHRADTSGGGLTDGEKIFRYGLNPFVQDTDGDGYDDAEEVANGQNPTVTTPGADRTIRYVYDEDDRLTGTYFGRGAGRTLTTLTPAGNPTSVEKKGE